MAALIDLAASLMTRHSGCEQMALPCIQRDLVTDDHRYPLLAQLGNQLRIGEHFSCQRGRFVGLRAHGSGENLDYRQLEPEPDAESELPAEWQVDGELVRIRLRWPQSLALSLPTLRALLLPAH